MDHYLSTVLWKELVEDYDILLSKPPEDSVRTVALSQLKDDATCHEYVSWLKEYIGAPDLQVAASMLIKRLGYLWTAPFITAMTFHNVKLSLDLNQSFLYHSSSIVDDGGTRFPFLAMGGLQIDVNAKDPANVNTNTKTSANTNANAAAISSDLVDREMWRKEVIEEMFAVQLAPVLHTLAKIGPVSKAVLWENIMVRIAPLYSGRVEVADQDKERVQADFAFLTQTASGDLFGERRNPFTRFTDLREDTPVAKSNRITCCYYYRMSGEYCVKCPKK
ncbi:ferric iron reductase protein FhuF [Paenibacillus turicensis]|uniref:Ferric iron reductase protein FhuF n=1 Tax=Paenibacillus turicensis TaxID=160487 RepID=A0ABS4FT69_9BACL|nr:IucA/IucC family C-terminal-domain containing protein [Paenibacillus turicensis]MBP1905779.1 ferric iron reductase protein FhuF [Paenibacillus turicensis]